MKRTQIVLAVLLLISLLGTIAFNHMVNAQSEDQEPVRKAPFKITVEPDNFTVETDEDIIFTIYIEAEEDFKSQVDLELEISFVGCNMTINMYPLYPPFPRAQEATIEVPSLARAGIAKGILRANSREYSTVNNIEILITDEAVENIDEDSDLMKERVKEEKDLRERFFQSMNDAYDELMEELARLMHALSRIRLFNFLTKY